MTKYWFWTSALFLSAAGLFPQHVFALTDAEIDSELQGVARDTNAKLPMGNSQSVVISVVALPGKRFAYKTLVGTPARQWSTEMRAHSLRIAVNNYCSSPQMAAFKEFGVTVSWDLADREGNHITTNTVSPKQCRR